MRIEEEQSELYHCEACPQPRPHQRVSKRRRIEKAKTQRPFAAGAVPRFSSASAPFGGEAPAKEKDGGGGFTADFVPETVRFQRAASTIRTKTTAPGGRRRCGAQGCFGSNGGVEEEGPRANAGEEVKGRNRKGKGRFRSSAAFARGCAAAERVVEARCFRSKGGCCERGRFVAKTQGETRQSTPLQAFRAGRAAAPRRVGAGAARARGGGTVAAAAARREHFDDLQVGTLLLRARRRPPRPRGAPQAVQAPPGH
mmetsp:Transcript_10694/g.35520  ORF Transcript_10694/g.35520 Transcript_10694/m.35520 type:complete len:255 (+) Transcript_10694:187-951(+)